MENRVILRVFVPLWFTPIVDAKAAEAIKSKMLTAPGPVNQIL